MKDELTSRRGLAEKSRRLQARIVEPPGTLDFAASGINWKFKEFTRIRSLIRRIARLEASKLSQLLRVNAIRASQAADNLVSALEVSQIRRLSDSNSEPASISVLTGRADVLFYQKLDPSRDSRGIVATGFQMGQGLGNQLWAYAVTRLAAKRSEQGFAIVGENNYKGRGIITLDFGRLLDMPGFPASETMEQISEKCDRSPSGEDVSRSDPLIIFPPRNSYLLGNFQSYEYLRGHEDWLRSELKLTLGPIELPENVTVLHIRMGDFVGNPVWLGYGYYRQAIDWVRKHYPTNRFLIVSDQPQRAAKLLRLAANEIAQRPKTSSTVDSTIAPHHFGSDLSGDFRIMYSAKSLVLPASSLSWWAAFLSIENKEFVLAPDRWAAHNVAGKFWSTAEIATPGFSYLTKSGDVRLK